MIVLRPNMASIERLEDFVDKIIMLATLFIIDRVRLRGELFLVLFHDVVEVLCGGRK